MTEAESKTLQAKEKAEVAAAAEQTRPGLVFTPAVDIFETDNEIALLADMPGVKAGALNIDLHENVLTLDGPEHRLVIKNEEEFRAPTKSEDPFAWELLRTTLKNAGKLEEVSTVNSAMLKFKLKKEKWPPDVVKSIMGLVTTGIKKTISLVKK